MLSLVLAVPISHSAERPNPLLNRTPRRRRWRAVSSAPVNSLARTSEIAGSSGTRKEQNDGLQIRWHFGHSHTRRRYLGDYQHLPKLRFKREEADLDTRCGAAAIARIDPLVSLGAARPSVTWKSAFAYTASRRVSSGALLFENGAGKS